MNRSVRFSPQTVLGEKLNHASKKSALALIAWAAYLTGLIWRAYFILFRYPATDYIYSDMAGYVVNAKHFATNHTTDIFHPPGTAVFFGLLCRWDPTWSLAIGAQFAISVLVPVVIALLAKEIYGNKVASAALMISSLYFPFIKYAALFLAENGYLLLLLCSLLFFVKTFKTQITGREIILGLLSGLFAGLAASFKNSVLSPAGLLLLGFVYLSRKRGLRIPVPGICAMTLGLILLLAPMSYRCTDLNHGTFCLTATNWSVNVLMGHYGKIRTFIWADGTNFSSPAYKRYTGSVALPFGVHESGQNLAAAWRWSQDNLWGALELSIKHILHLFAFSTPWPSLDDREIAMTKLFQILFWIFILVPAFLCILFRASPRRYVSLGDWILLAPILGLMITVFFSVAEPRYRIPFDGFFIILASRFYAGLFFNMDWHLPDFLTGTAETRETYPLGKPDVAA